MTTPLELALKLPCPKCSAVAGEPCEDLTRLPELRHAWPSKKTPHQERIDKATELLERIIHDGLEIEGYA